MPVDIPARQRAVRSTDLESCSSGLKSRGSKINRVLKFHHSFYKGIGFHTKIPHFFEIWPNIPIYLMFAVQISIPYQYTSFWGSGIPIYLMFSENSSNIPIYRMHDLGAQKGHTNIPHVFEKWPNIPIYLNLTSTRKLLQAHCYIGIYPT